MPADDDTLRALEPTAVADTSADDTQAAGQEALPAAARGPVLATGTLVGRYRIEACLGAGGMGIVYRARDTELDRAVALKLVRPQANATELTERLRRESRLQARAAHESVITVYDIGRDGNQVFVAMELIDGATLTGWLEMRPRAWREILDVFREAAHGLAAAHAAGLVHRDFKPDNVLVEIRDGRATRVLVSDFGVARALEDADATAERMSAAKLGMTATGALVGTPAYMSPEQLDAQPADERADVFSFCVSLWEALYDERPFRGSSLTEIIASFDHVPQPPARTRVPGWVAEALRGGLAIDRDRRTASMTRLIAILDWRRRRSRRIALASAAAGVLAIGGVVAAATLTREPSVCELPPTVAADVVRAGNGVATLLQRESPSLADYWRSSTAGYARAWGLLRAQACVMREEEEARCLEQLGAEMVSLLDAARQADPVRRGDLLRSNVGTVAPHECLSSPTVAAALTALFPDDPRVRSARRAMDAAAGAWYRDREASRTGFAEARALVKAQHFEPLQLELEGLEAEHANKLESDSLELRSVAQAADRAGNYSLAASLWIEATLGLRNQGELLLAADNSLIRAGDPPRLRAWWHLQRAAGYALRHDAANTQVELKRAQATLDFAGMPYDFRVDRAMASLLTRLGDHAGSAQRYARVKDFAVRSGAGGPYLMGLRSELAKSLFWSGRPDEAGAEVDAVLADLDPNRPLPSDELVPVIRLYAEMVVWTEPAEALARLQRWAPALDATLARDALWRGHIESVKALAFASLGRFEEAERSARRALEIQVLHLGADAGNTAETRLLVGQILLELHKDSEAEDQLRRGITDLAAASSDDLMRVAQARAILARHLVEKKRNDDARPLAEQALRVYETSTEAPVSERGDLRWTLATALGSTDPTRVRALVEGAITDWSAGPAPDKALLSAARARLRALGKP